LRVGRCGDRAAGKGLPTMVLSWLIALFVFMPVVELALLLKVGSALGVAKTLVLVVGTGVIGAFLARAQGVMILTAIHRELNEGRMPAPRLLDGVMVLVAGTLLITPGLITDTAGFLLLVPSVRGWIRKWLRRKLEQRIRTGEVSMWRW